MRSRSLVNLSPPLRTEEELREDAEERGWLAKALTSKGSDLAIAFLCTKALLPVRAPVTLALTPAVARCTPPFLLLVAASLSRGVGFPQLLPPSVSTYAYKSCVTIQKAPGRQRWIPRKALCYNVRCVVS